MSHLPSKQARCSHPQTLARVNPHNPAHPLSAGTEGAGSRERGCCGGFVGRWLGFVVGGSQSPAAMLCRGMAPCSPGKPCGEGWLWTCPALAARVSWIHSGDRILLPCHQHLQNAVWIGLLQAACRGDTAQPLERGPLHQGIPSFIKDPSTGEEAPSPYWCEWGSQSGPVPGIQGSLGKGGSFMASRGPECLQDRMGFGTWGRRWGCWGALPGSERLRGLG